MQQVEKDVLYLLSCMANRQKAEKNRIQSMDLDALYELCKQHNITALIASVLTEHIKENPAQYAKWKQEQMKAVYRDMNFAAERASVLSFLENNGIWYMPLKGIVLKDYYPKPELREFADNDILFDASHEQEVETYMLSAGYTRRQSDSGHVMEYEKEPCFNFEMHRALYHTNNAVFYDYYQDVKSRLLKDENNRFGYHFSDEDFYIFMVSHAFRHYRDSGVGIRSLLDIYVFLQTKEQKLHWEYVENELKKIDADAFETTMRSLAKKVFGSENPVLSQDDEAILEYYFKSGTYGTEEIFALNRMKRMTGSADFSAQGRRKYWLKRLFDLEQYKREYPRAYKTIVLIPFLVLFRALRGLTKLGKIKKENEQLKELEQ